MVGGKLKQGLRSGQRILPVFDFLAERLSAHVLPLPLRVVRILNGKLGKLWIFILEERRIALRHITEKTGNRPPVTDDMVHDDQQDAGFRSQANQQGTEKWPFTQVKRFLAFLARKAKRLGFALSLRNRGQIDDGHLNIYVG